MRRLASTALLAASFASTVSAAPALRHRVLLVYHTDGAIPANVKFERAFIERLRDKSGPNLEFYREQLDSARFPDYVERRIAELRSRYADRGIDVVVFFGNIPTTILPGVPVIQVDNELSDQAVASAYGTNAVHVSFQLDVRKIVDMARQLQPKARKVLLITGASASDLVYLEQFRERLNGYSNLEIESLGNASIEELSSRLSHLPRDVIVLPISYFLDPQGNSYISRDVIGRLANISTAPVYASSDTYVGTGPVGGYVVSWDKTGELVSEAAYQIFQGKAPADVVLSAPGSGVYMFDWRQLKRWGFSEDRLPPDSIVEFRTFTVWEMYRWRIVGVGVLLAAQSLLIVALLVHRSRRRRAEMSLRDMAGRLLQSQDDERRRIARDLHDGTGQHLSGIALGVGQVLADFPPGYDRLRKLLQESHMAARQALNEIRAVSYALHPPILDGLGLVPALQWYLEGLQKRTNFSIDFDASHDLGGTIPEVDRTLFRVVQECVTNVLRHSGGTAMKVKLYDGGKGITLEVEDNGHGMSAEELERVEGAATLGVGIAGMRERVRQFDGTFRINSGPNGTRLLVSLPTHEVHYAAHTVGG